ncbi:ATP-binding protein [Isoptericola croceus]|uniref:ATP-binding protein n=1 Tax=Isoptericola croceus TaxID=3031406 RepID=UPI0023F7C5EC|nr:ATP-binding protein [Isoptericola croceus]
MQSFVGRATELATLNGLLNRASESSDRPGRAILVRGRRRVGKSRLVEEFIDRAEVPSFFFTAAGGPPTADLADFAAELAASTLPDSEVAASSEPPATWSVALQLLASALPTDRPSIVVLDEMPYLVRADPSFEGALQRAFDRLFSRLPVLLVLVGSDLATMEQINTYGRPFYQRATEMVVPPLNPADVSSLLSLDASDALDAYLVTGGLPLVLDAWPTGADLWTYLSDALTDPTSALLVSGERSLAAELPTEAQARTVLRAIGHGERTFTTIGRTSGLPAASLNRALDLLTARRIVAADTPLSTRPSKETRYRVDDPYLRFWLHFVGPGIPLIDRGRGDLLLRRVRDGWTSWRGRAVEPIVREALWRTVGPELFPETAAVGGYWTRNNDPEIDLVGADRSGVAKHLTFVGSVKWLEHRAFDHRDLARLHRHRDQLPGATDETPLVAVSRAGFDVDGVTAVGPDDLLGAWTASA